MKQLAGASLDHCVYVWNFKQQLRAFRFMGHTVRACVEYYFCFCSCACGALSLFRLDASNEIRIANLKV